MTKFKEGERVTYHHGMLERDFDVQVVKVTKRQVQVRFNDPGERSMYGITRWLSHRCAAETLTH